MYVCTSVCATCMYCIMCCIWRNKRRLVARAYTQAHTHTPNDMRALSFNQCVAAIRNFRRKLRVRAAFSRCARTLCHDLTRRYTTYVAAAPATSRRRRRPPCITSAVDVTTIPDVGGPPRALHHAAAAARVHADGPSSPVWCRRRRGRWDILSPASTLLLRQWRIQFQGIHREAGDRNRTSSSIFLPVFSHSLPRVLFAFPPSPVSPLLSCLLAETPGSIHARKFCNF